MPPTAPHRFRFAIVLMSGGVAAFGGCSSEPKSSGVFGNGGAMTSGSASSPARVSREQLQGNLMAYADRFLARIEQATDSIEAGTTDPQARLMAHSAKYYPSLAVVTTAADADTEVALLDLVAMVTLERAVWAEGWAEAEFGPLAADLLKAHEELELDAWSMASRVLNDEQLATLRSVIAGWRAEHPEQKYVATVRFDDFMLLRDMDLRRRSTLIKVNLVLTDTDAAAAEIRKSRLFAERALFLAGRMPLLMSWQAELLAYDLALAPEVTQSLQNAAEVSASIQQLAADVNALPQRLDEQMRSTFDALEERRAGIDSTVTNVRQGLEQADAVAVRLDAVATNLQDVAKETRTAAEALNQMVQSADGLVARFDQPEATASQPGDSEARPFDIREYTLALTELTGAAKELNALVHESDAMLQSPAWQARVGEIDAAAGKRIEQVDELSQRWLSDLDDRAAALTDRMTIRGSSLIAVACVAGLITTALYRHISRRT